VYIAVVALALLIALVLWIKPRKLATWWPRPRPAAPELPSLLPSLFAPLLAEIAQLRHEIRDERLARAAGLAAERFAGHGAMRLAAETSRPPLLDLVAEREPSAIEVALPPITRAGTDLDDGEITEAEHTRVQAALSGRVVLSTAERVPRAPARRLPTMNPPPLGPLAFPDSLIGSEDIPEEVRSVIGPGSGLGPDDDTPPLGNRGVRASVEQ
jgi:hypothetical protein